MIWDSIRGHEEPLALFRRSASRGRLAHAYLFVGPEGIGKKRFARLLAQCLLCERYSEAELDACGQCSACRQVQAGTHPDLFLVGCPEGKSELPIELIAGRDEHRGQEGLCYELSLKPMAGRRKIALIDDANLMNAESANALLKTLEEPSPDSLLILIAHNADGLLPTIRSRSQQVRFAPLPANVVADLLMEERFVSETGEAETVAALSEGSLAIAGQLLDPELQRLRDQLYDRLAEEPFNSVATAQEMIDGVEALGGDSAAQRRHGQWLVRFVIEFYRQVVRELSSDESQTPVAQVRTVAGRLDAANPDDLEGIMQLFDRATQAERQLERRMPLALSLEGLFDDLGRIGRTVGVS